MPLGPARRRDEPAGRQADVEDVLALQLLVGREEVEQERGEAAVGQHAGHPPVARAVAAAAAAVREHDRPGRLRARGDGQVPGQGEAGPDGDHHPRGRRRRVVVGRGRLRRARGEQRQHLAVVRGPEGLVPLADGAQVAWLQHAHHVVGLGLQRRHALRRAHRHGQDQPPRSPRADRAQRRPRRPPVARPSSTMMTVRPATSSGGRPPR